MCDVLGCIRRDGYKSVRGFREHLQLKHGYNERDAAAMARLAFYPYLVGPSPHFLAVPGSAQTANSGDISPMNLDFLERQISASAPPGSGNISAMAPSTSATDPANLQAQPRYIPLPYEYPHMHADPSGRVNYTMAGHSPATDDGVVDISERSLGWEQGWTSDIVPEF